MQQLQPNTLLQGGKYKIINELGQGGFGITYLAVQSGLDRKVAIKEFFMKELCERDESTSHVTLGTEGSRETVSRFREKFLKEARNIARLNHPHIVRIIDVFEENGTAYYVMEYAENGSLADKVKREGYLSEPVATRYILQVAEALDYIHQQKMNHLDVKPANIMLNEKDEAVLIDFGLSKQYDATTGNQTSTTPVGISEGYAPMEQYMGVNTFSPETDVYSLGATFYKLLTGITPPNASVVNNDGLPVDDLKAKGVSQNAIGTISRAMEGRKKDRTKNVRLFISGLDAKNVSAKPNADEPIQKSDESQDTSEETVVVVPENKQTEKSDKAFDNAKKPTKESLDFDRNALTYEVADMIVNSGFDEVTSLNYLTSTKKVPADVADEILQDAAELVRQSNKEAGKKDVMQGAIWIVAGVVLSALSGGVMLFYGAPLYGGYLLVRGCKSLFTSQVYGRKMIAKWKVLAGIVAVFAVIFGITHFFNSYSKQNTFISAHNKLIGYGVNMNESEAIKEIEALAKDGYGPALYCMYQTYVYGTNGYDIDTLQAGEYLNKASIALENEANKGDMCSQYYLGLSYLYGIGRKADRFAAEKWILESSSKGYAPAETELGGIYMSDQNKADECFSILRKAAENKYPKSLYYLAYCYANSIGTEQDSLAFANLLKESSDLKEVNALRDLGCFMLQGNSYINQDATKGLEYIKIASERGNINARMDWAYCLLNGIGCDVNPNEAINAVMPLATIYHRHDAQLLLGYCHDALQSYNEAVSWYRQSADQGNPTAQYQLSLHYRQGLGVTQSDAWAEEWYDKAIQNGYSDNQ